jgi:hypothetical protein
MRTRRTIAVAALSLVLARVAPAAAAADVEPDSATEINKKLSNPVSSIWALQLQNNNYLLNVPKPGADRWNNVLTFQPVLPVPLTKDWNLVTRPVFTLLDAQPFPQSDGHFRTSVGFGDTILASMLSPANAGHWLLGIGPSFIFPTASHDQTGQGKVSAGPAGVVGYLGEHWIAFLFPQQWFSFAGTGSRRTVSQMNLQYGFNYFLPDGWAIGTTPNVLINWRGDGGQQVTLPIGPTLSKVLKFGPLPVKLQLAGQYMPIRPDELGQKVNVQITITPVIPRLVEHPIFGD